MKKAFCEPGNAAFCPPLGIACELVLRHGAPPELAVKKNAEDGGDRVYTGRGGVAEARADFAAGALHPGDLKPAVSGRGRSREIAGDHGGSREWPLPHKG
eukprot:scaffold24557_cov51-Isochrysis_galbana.AAC.1